MKYTAEADSGATYCRLGVERLRPPPPIPSGRRSTRGPDPPAPAMPKFPQSFIDEVRAAADIVAVIQDYVSLRKAGASYKGLCPFHSEKSPSFTVNRDKGFFHCFGCQVGGDVFKFVELQEKLGFQDTVKHVAQKFGIPVPELEAGDGQVESAAEREALLKMHEVAAAYFAEQLASPAGDGSATTCSASAGSPPRRSPR